MALGRGWKDTMQKILGHLTNTAVSLKVLGGAGILRPYSPKTLAGLAAILKAWGTGPAGGFAARHLGAAAPQRLRAGWLISRTHVACSPAPTNSFGPPWSYFPQCQDVSRSPFCASASRPTLAP